MARQVDIELIKYRGIRDWRPQAGDVVIKHGWLTRTKWFGVVNYIHPDGSLDIIKDGMMRLLVTTPPDGIKSKLMNINPELIRGSIGGYTVQQQLPGEVVIWYV